MSRPPPSLRFSSRPAASRQGTSLIELVMVVTIIGILVSLSVPTFHRALEQSRADLAAANLRAIWSAERLYWLDNREFTSDLSALRSLGLLDSSIVDSSSFYIYEITSASADAFAAQATRVANARFNGSFGITDSGTVTGALSAPNEADLTPGFQRRTLHIRIDRRSNARLAPLGEAFRDAQASRCSSWKWPSSSSASP